MKWILLALLVTNGCALHRRVSSGPTSYVLGGKIAATDLFCVERSATDEPIAAKLVCVRVGDVRHFIRGLRSAE